MCRHIYVCVCIYIHKGFPGGMVVNNHPPANAGDTVRFLSGEDPLEKGIWHPTPVFLSGESHGQRSLVGYSPWGHKELGTIEQAHSHTHIHTHV